MRAPTYAEATSTLALFIALGGVSWAATTLPKNSVNSAAIRDAQVRSADLAPGSVSATKLSKQLRSQLGVTTGKDGGSGANGSNGANGAAGSTGAQGPQGAAGRDGAAIAAIGKFGDHDVWGTSWVKAGEMTWTQPAGALDDIRGLYSALRDSACGNGAGGAAYRIMVDGQELSFDFGNQGADAQSSLDPDPRITPPWTPVHDSPDRGTFGTELPVLGTDQPTTHKLELFFRREGCTSPIRLRDVQIYVTRFLA
jgi:hypothetical protein